MLEEQTMLLVGTNVEGSNGESYLVEAILGQGGFSAVYRVREQAGEQRVFALKEVIDPNPQGRDNLTLEAEILMSLKHSSLPHVYQVFENVKLKRIFMLMDFIDGKNLEVLRQEQSEQRFSLSLALTLMTPIVDAVSYLHTCKPPIVHRDIKPANIIVPTEGTDAQLVDFGLAKEYEEDKTTSIFRCATPGYAAPEQYVKGTNQRTDIYALGATLYTLLTGSIPTDALNRSFNLQDSDPFQTASEICPTVPEAVSRIIDQAMSLRAVSRFATVEEFWRSLCNAAIPYAGAVPHPFAHQASEEHSDFPSQVNVVVASQGAKPLPTPASTRPTRSSNYANTHIWRIVLLLIALIIVIISSLSIWASSTIPSIEGSGALRMSPAAGKQTGTRTLHNTSSVVINPTANAPVPVGKSGSASNTPAVNLYSLTPSSLPSATNPPSPATNPPSPATNPPPPATNPPTPAADCITGSPSVLTFSSLKKGENPAPEILTLTNCGGQSGWTAAPQTNDGNTWLTISPSQGAITLNGSENIQVGVQNASLAYGTYQGSIHFAQGTASWDVTVVNIVQKK